MESGNEVLVQDLFETLGKDLDFAVVAGKVGLKNSIHAPEVQRPGLALAGFLDYFDSKNIQIIGQTELAYMSARPEAVMIRNWSAYLSHHPPLVIVTRELSLAPALLEIADRLGVCIFSSPKKTDFLIHKIGLYLERELAPTEMIHGVLMDVFGLGVLIQGESGVGKSETALELLQRGHRLVSDDIVEVRKMRQEILRGKSPDLTKHHIEIRGLGILNIRQLYGASAVVDEMDVSMVAKMERWREGYEYDRLGLDQEKTMILGIEIPSILVPVQPGRNIAIIIEVGAMNQRLKNMGVHVAEEFSLRLEKILEEKKI